MLRFSIIMPSLNQGRFLEQSLQSVFSQHVPSPQLVVVDGGSSDGTHAILSGHQDRLRWISEPDQGPADAFNKGLRMTDGEVVGWLNPDDIYFPNALPTVADFFASHPEVDVVYGAVQQMDCQGEAVETIEAAPWSLGRLKKDCFVHLPAVFFRRRLLQHGGELAGHLRYWADYDFWLQLADAGATFEPLAALLGGRRVRADAHRVGTQCYRQQAACWTELNNVLASRTGYVSPRKVLQYAHAQAMAEGVSRDSSGNFDVTILRHGLKGLKRWNWPAGRMSQAATILGLVGRHLGKELDFLVRHPHFATRFLPQPARGFLENHLRRKLFKLRVHDPRPVRLPAHYAARTTLVDPPMISIVTPNLNQGAYLEQTICSILEQRYPRLEYVIQDGGSKDNSLEIIRRYAGQLTRWDSAPDRGQAHAINRGMQHTTGPIMAFLNSDDLLLPGSLAYVAQYFQQHPEADVVYGHRLLIDEHSCEIGRWVLPPHDDRVIPWADFIPQETMFWRRTAWERVGGLDESFHFALDWDLILRFRDAGLRFVRLPRFLGAFRVTDQTKTSQLVQTVGQREMARLRQRVLGREPTSREIRRVVRPYIRRHFLCETLYSLGLARY